MKDPLSCNACFHTVRGLESQTYYLVWPQSQNDFTKLILIVFNDCLLLVYNAVLSVSHLIFVNQQPRKLNSPKLYPSNSLAVLALQVSQIETIFKTLFAQDHLEEFFLSSIQNLKRKSCSATIILYQFPALLSSLQFLRVGLQFFFGGQLFSILRELLSYQLKRQETFCYFQKKKKIVYFCVVLNKPCLLKAQSLHFS